ncbi:MAG: amidohydrolase [Clostridiales bacterium]|jgi:5-methylthioadenosine/S-adenosylhomocysteine deaminase|nr:amidohydrolase [Clostridiales bacterium]
MIDYIFKNVTLVPMIGDDVIYNACVGIDGSHIAFVRATDQPGTQAQRIIDGTGKILMPGLYNCHAHSPMSLMRGYAGEKNLQDWLFNYIFPAEAKFTPDMVYAGAMLSIAEMISSGTVSFTDMYFYIPFIAQAVYETGMKANISNAMTALNDVDYHNSRCYQESLELLKNFHGKGDNRVKLDASIHAEYTSGPSAWRDVVEFAQKHDLRMHVHLSETKSEHEECKERHGKTPTAVFADNGVFDTPTTAAHCVWIEDEDCDILFRHRVNVAHNPVSNLKLASGIAPVTKMRAKGVEVVVGTDGVSSNNSHDLFEEIKMTCLLQKYLTNDPTAMPALDALKMATVGGASSQGRNSGAILPGREADLILIDTDNARQQPINDPIANLAYNTTGRDVCLTMANGKILYENGEFLTLDIERALRLIKEAKVY